MFYKIMVGDKYLVGENVEKTLKGTMRGDTAAVFSFNFGEMSAYDFTDDSEMAGIFARNTASEYISGIMERQFWGFYLGQIKLFDSKDSETLVHCNVEKNARLIAMILDFDNLGKEFDWYEQHIDQLDKYWEKLKVK